MEEATRRDLFLQSLKRCGDEEFARSFYTRFLSSSDEIREKFENTDFDHQRRILLTALRLISGATAGDRVALREIRELAESHGRDQLNIEPRLYDLWRAAIVETAREFDVHWSDDTEDAWNHALGHVINYMVKYY